MLVSSLFVLLASYVAGISRLWRSAGVGRGIRPFEVAAFAGGWLALAVALSPAMDEWSDQWLAAHMVQHELLMVVAAPLFAVSAPLIAWLWALPAPARRVLIAGFGVSPIPAVWRAATAPLTVFILHALALWIWHLPALYIFALDHEGVHFVEHLCFLGTAALFWWGIAHGRYGRAGYGVAVIYIFATTLHGGVLGALLTLSTRVWYAPYQHAHPGGFTALEDQQLAGLLMWVPGSLLLVVGGLALFAAWLRQSERMTAITGSRVPGVFTGERPQNPQAEVTR